MADNPVGWFGIHAQEMARAKAFYENVFGLPL
ncbi:Predicted enzyme related to lactoylglutathione lyase [Kingella potus]|uniref:Predicted enzyme related to lactoylglutathione lyase n=1 Tax=Kingella potus TaxID=265175 RepID=A0A377R353_9NEIS|nr:Predicted enzyme related to lactoylglutathione lyase [Kingella potus]